MICASGIGARSGFSVLMVDCVPNYDVLEKAICFPLYKYPTQKEGGDTDSFELPLLDNQVDCSREFAICEDAFKDFQKAYPHETINQEDVFYYVYGLLHSQEYQDKFADNLAKEFPRIPCVKESQDFWRFSDAGRKLSDIHLNYERVDMYPAEVVASENLSLADYRVEKMSYARSGKSKDLTTVHYNEKIMVKEIPIDAYDYIVAGKPALDWVMDRQRYKLHAESGIANDANDWAIETMENPKYPLELFLRMITVSLETMKIVRGLPKLDI